ncbi:UNVERIFIED_CONTAM: 2,4-dienoyl CoA reductase 2, peroxisomal family protein [Hammondia hammondi]|eukprot:XP_008882000.1 2,4-dienoyl CoA reductase 2, peroxisomal family protein [Hammondia hammondi]
MESDRRQPSFRQDCLHGKVAFITGGGSGICREIAKQFLLHGASVVIASRNKKKLQDAAKHLGSETGGCCFPVAMDVRSEKEVAQAVDAAMAKFGKVDILVNGAAGNFLCSAEKLTYKGFKTVMEIDAHGTFIVSKTVFEKCFKPAIQRAKTAASRGSEGRLDRRSSGEASCEKVILNISMTLHYTAALLQTHAGAAKAAVDAMTKHLAVEWGPYNIRVNCIAPGPVEGTVGFNKLNPVPQQGLADTRGNGTGKPTDPTEDSDKDEGLSSSVEPKMLQKESQVDGQYKDLNMLQRFIPLQRLGTVQDMAFAAMFLCLPEASYITGANLVVDGGQWMTSGNFTVLEPHQNETWRNALYQIDSRL